MKKARQTIAVKALRVNSGQLEWLPKNPRQWTKQDLDRTIKSIEEDPDFLEDRPALVVPLGELFLVFAGNLRTTGAKKRKQKEMPCVVYYPETDEDRLTIKRRAMKDNGAFGSFDFDILANEWDDLPLTDWGVPAWDTAPDMSNGLSSDGMEKGEGYEEFLDKFKPKLTTDDCFTPPAVYDIVRDFVDQNVAKLEGRKVVRPFFPGGNYEDLTQYPKGCVVLDNPPFSIYAKVIRFYCEHGIDFWLFGPNLTLFTSKADVCYVVANLPIKYENGAIVATGFTTNMVKDLRVWVEGSMYQKVVEIQNEAADLEKYELPPSVVTSARLGKLCKYNIELKIKRNDCQYVHTLEKMEKGLYGGGFLLSDAAAAAAAAAAAKAKAETALTAVELSDKEKAIIEELSKQDE